MKNRPNREKATASINKQFFWFTVIWKVVVCATKHWKVLEREPLSHFLDEKGSRKRSHGLRCATVTKSFMWSLLLLPRNIKIHVILWPHFHVFISTRSKTQEYLDGVFFSWGSCQQNTIPFWDIQKQKVFSLIIFMWNMKKGRKRNLIWVKISVRKPQNKWTVLNFSAFFLGCFNMLPPKMGLVTSSSLHLFFKLTKRSNCNVNFLSLVAAKKVHQVQKIDFDLLKIVLSLKCKGIFSIATIFL